MRRITIYEQQLITKLLVFSEGKSSFYVGQFVDNLELSSLKALLEISFLFWFLQDNGYVYLTWNPKVKYESEDINIGVFLNQLQDESLRKRVKELLSSVVFVSNQLIDLRNNLFLSIEEKQLNASEALVTQAKEQSDQAKKQTSRAGWTLLLSILTFLASIFVPLFLSSNNSRAVLLSSTNEKESDSLFYSSKEANLGDSIYLECVDSLVIPDEETSIIDSSRAIHSH